MDREDMNECYITIVNDEINKGGIEIEKGVILSQYNGYFNLRKDISDL